MTENLTIGNESTESVLEQLNASDARYWKIIGENPYISEDYKNNLALLEINLKVAAIALCKLLIAIAPTPEKLSQESVWLEETGEITPKIIEAVFP